MDYGAHCRFSARTTKIRGSSSMNSIPMVLAALVAEVSLGTIANNGVYAFFDGDRAKASDGLWEKSNRNPFIMAIARKSGHRIGETIAKQ